MKTIDTVDHADAAVTPGSADDPAARPPENLAAEREAVALRSRLRPSDLFDEVLAGLFSRPARTALTTLGTVIGLASLIVTIGLSRTAGSQIIDQFNELAASQVIVTARSSGRTKTPIPWSVEDRLDRLNGVNAAGASADVQNPGQVRTVGFVDPSGDSERTVPVVAASAGLLNAVRGEISQGRWFDSGHVDREDHVAVIGSDLAAELGITRLDYQPGIYLGDNYFSVIGIIDKSPRDPGFLKAVVITSTVAADLFEVKQPSRVIIDVEIGAGELIAAQAPVALQPNAPDGLSVSAAQLPAGARDRVTGDVNSLFLALALVSLIVGAIGIANVTLVTVMERTSEIGLRRAMGAREHHIAAQVVSESVLVGLFGGIIGATAGVLVIVGVSAYREWTPVLDPWLPLAAPVAGALVGLLAGLYPAIRAARMEPVAALRGRT